MEADGSLNLTDVDSRRMLASMRQMDWREWSLWVSAMTVTLALVAGIASFGLPSVFSGVGILYSFFLDRAVTGLWGLVLLLNLYVVYEKSQINRIRREWADQMYVLAVIDPLTGLFNRRYIEQRLQSEIARSERDHLPLTVILFDLDHFKAVNDRCGHAVGDDVLRAFSERLKKATRGSDVVGRFGGDEFLAILPDCKTGDLPYVFRRLEGVQVERGGLPVPIEYSAGWTEYAGGETAAQLRERADAVLYVDKRRPRTASAFEVEAPLEVESKEPN